jgi:hypothetical protein
MDRPCGKQFSATNLDDLIDDVISRCWLGRLPAIGDLADHIQRIVALDQTDQVQEVVVLNPAYEARKKPCERHYQLRKT